MTKQPPWASMEPGHRLKTEEELRDEGFTLSPYGNILLGPDGESIDRFVCGARVYVSDDGYITTDGIFIDLEQSEWAVIQDRLH